MTSHSRGLIAMYSNCCWFPAVPLSKGRSQGATESWKLRREAKIVPIGAERRKNILSRTEKGRNGVSVLPLGWKVEQRIQISPSAYRSFQTALSSLDFVYGNASSPTPTPQKSWNRPNEQNEHFISSLRNFIIRYLNFIQMPFRVLKLAMDESGTQHRVL